jgi:high-affinity nickel permease
MSRFGYYECVNQCEEKIVGYGLVGILVIILLVVAIVYFVRRA